MPRTSDNSRKRRKDLRNLQLLLNLGLDRLIKLDIPQQSILRFRFDLLILKIFQRLLAHLHIMFNRKELQSLEEKCIRFQRAESYIEFCRGVGL